MWNRKELGFCVLSLALVGGCSKASEEGKSETVDSKGEAAQTQPVEKGTSGEKGQAGTATEAKPGPRLLGEKAKVELLAEGVERRLYTDRVEASSFLWVNYNRFQENYHPNYILDGDPRTAWIEGADENGIGEWLRFNLSPLKEVSKLRLRVQNGYHKTEKLFKQNARVTKLELKALPGGESKTFELEDDMEWQELVWELEKDELEAFELKVLGAAKGTKYKDLALSDIEIFVTARTKENPAFEKKKLDKLLAWKQSRLDAVKIFNSTAAKELPIKPGYRVKKVGEVPKLEERSGKHPRAEHALNALRAEVDGQDALFDRASEAVKQGFKDWKVYELTVRKAPQIPDVDGLVRQDQESLIYSWPSDAFVLPEAKRRTLINNKRISLFESKRETLDMNNVDDCEPNEVYGMRKPKDADGPSPKELVVWHCVEEEEREGTYTYLTWELYEYDDAGHLVLSVGPTRAQFLDWQAEEGRQLLVGGTRIDSYDRKIRKLVSDEAVAMTQDSQQTEE